MIQMPAMPCSIAQRALAISSSTVSPCTGAIALIRGERRATPDEPFVVRVHQPPRMPVTSFGIAAERQQQLVVRRRIDHHHAPQADTGGEQQLAFDPHHVHDLEPPVHIDGAWRCRTLGGPKALLPQFCLIARIARNVGIVRGAPRLRHDQLGDGLGHLAECIDPDLRGHHFVAVGIDDPPGMGRDHRRQWGGSGCECGHASGHSPVRARRRSARASVYRCAGALARAVSLRASRQR